MTNCHKGTLYPVLFVIVVALASVALVVTGPQIATASAPPIAGDNSDSGGFGSGDSGGGGIVGSGSIAKLDLEKAAEAENATMMTTTNGNTTEFMAIQNAKSGSLSQINDTAYTLELDNVANKTIQFSDRPARVVETVSTADFIGNWTSGPNSFAADAPNDALIVENTQTGQLETAIIESFSPVYDTNTNTLTYTIMAENRTSVSLPGEFGQTVLVIDASQTIPCAGCVIQ